MSTGLRTTFWIHAVVAFVFGIGYLFAPAFVAGVFDVEPFDPFVTRLYGAAAIGLCASSVLAALAKRWEQVAIVVEMEVVFTILSAAVCLYAIIFANASVMVWLAVAMFSFFFLLFGYFLLQERIVHVAEPGTPALQ